MSDNSQKPETFVSIALALANDYTQLFIIDSDTFRYEEYSVSKNNKELVKVSSGDDFFTETYKNVRKIVYPDDRKFFLSMISKNNILHALKRGQSVSFSYRLIINGAPHYYFLKTIGSGEKKIIIGVQDIDEQKRSEKRIESYAHIAAAIASRYEVIYYIDADTNEYSVYNASEQYSKLGITTHGADFFKDCLENIKKYIYDADISMMLTELNKEHLLERLSQKSSFSLKYRQFLDGRYQYLNMTVVRSPEDMGHIVVGVYNIDSQMRREESLAAERRAFGNIARALAERYEIIYSVNTLTNEYMEYSSSKKYSELEEGVKGKDFFEACKVNMKKELFPEDVPMMLEAMEKEKLMKTLDEYGKTFYNFRQIIDDKPQYMSLYAIRPKEDSAHIIIAVANIDASKRMEIAYHDAVNIANKDALTGVKNKRSYVHMEMEMDELIKKSEPMEFAVAVCDVNYLKQINDTQGHSAGDEYIKTACKIICKVFTHSPVFRIGGDEFAVLLKGDDFQNKSALLQKLDTVLNSSKQNGIRIIAYGLSEYVPEKDIRFQDVFKRADYLMYEDKKACKNEAETQ